MSDWTTLGVIAIGALASAVWAFVMFRVTLSLQRQNRDLVKTILTMAQTTPPFAAGVGAQLAQQMEETDHAQVVAENNGHAATARSTMRPAL